MSKGGCLVQTKMLIPLALLWIWRAAGCSRHGLPAIKRPGLLPTSFCCFHPNPPAIITPEHAGFQGDWQQRSGRNLVPASQTGLFPLLCPEHIPLLMDIGVGD